MPTKNEHIKSLANALGFLKAINILMLRALRINKPIFVNIGPNKLSVRPCDSDLFVLGQIFGAEEYDLGFKIKNKINRLAKSYKDQGKKPVIIDAGANVGYSAIYFANNYPDAYIIAIEPDYDTYNVMNKNCSDHKRIIPIHAALWSHSNGVDLNNLTDSSWARTVTDQGPTPSYTLKDIISIFPNTAPLILKMDIEGAEKEVVEAAPEVVGCFPVIMVEPHDFMKPGSACLSPLYSAIGNNAYDTIIRGENLILINANEIKLNYN